MSGLLAAVVMPIYTAGLLVTGDGFLKVFELKNEPNDGDVDGAQLVITDAREVYERGENTTLKIDNSMVPRTGISVGQTTTT